MNKSKADTQICRLLEEGSAKLNIRLNDTDIDNLRVYCNQLIHWSRKMNLIGRRLSLEQFVENHFLDSLTLLSLLDGDKVHLLDVGSGAGFPGLVCKSVRPILQLTLVEPRLKRVSFLNHIVRTLELTGVRVVASRLGDVALPVQDEEFSHIVSRAVTELDDFFHMVSSLMGPEVKILCMKGPKYIQELELAEETMERYALHLSCKLHLHLPFSGAERTLLVFEQKSALGRKSEY